MTENKVEDMLIGEKCAMCGVDLNCDECVQFATPAFCSYECAADHGQIDSGRVCSHQEGEIGQ